MGSLIAWLAAKQVRGQFIGEKPARLIAYAGLILILAAAAGIAVWASGRSERAQARVDRGQVAAATASAGDAVNTVGQAADREAASEALTRANERDIKAAPGAEVQVSRQVDAAGRAALCRREAYRNQPQCKGIK